MPYYIHRTQTIPTNTSPLILIRYAIPTKASMAS